MSEKEFERYLNEVFEETLSYDARFSKQDFEIGILVSKAACYLFSQHGYIPHAITEDSFNGSSYLFGHRIAFVNSNTIPIAGGGEFLIRPFVVCNSLGVFPMESEVGDYVFFNGNLVQVVSAGTLNGNRSFKIEDVEVELHDYLYRFPFDKADALRSTKNKLKKRKAKEDSWSDNVDTSAIDEYLSAITIT